MKRLVLILPVLPALIAACGDDACDPTVVGSICTIAGKERGYSGDDGPALDARFSWPQDTVTAGDGTIYILDWNNHRVRKVTTDGTIHHVAGRGELGGTLDDPANDDLNHPTGMLLDSTETTLWIAAWHNSMIRRIDLATGEIVTECGDGRRAYFGDGGPALTASLDLPASIAWSLEGDLVIMDQANQVIRKIDATDTITLVAGQCITDREPPDGAVCTDGEEPQPCPAPSGKTYCGGDPAVCTKACAPGYGGDGGPATEMRMAQPFGQSADPAGRMAYDASGNLYFADTSNALIRMIDTDGIVHRVAGVAPIDGVAQRGYSGDGGPATEAKLNNPVDLAVDDDRTIYLTDTANHCVRMVDPGGTISTLAGQCGTEGFEGDGRPAAESLLSRPFGLELTGDTLLITDSGNSRIRSIKLR